MRVDAASGTKLTPAAAKNAEAAAPVASAPTVSVAPAVSPAPAAASLTTGPALAQETLTSLLAVQGGVATAAAAVAVAAVQAVKLAPGAPAPAPQPVPPVAGPTPTPTPPTLTPTTAPRVDLARYRATPGIVEVVRGQLAAALPATDARPKLSTYEKAAQAVAQAQHLAAVQRASLRVTMRGQAALALLQGGQDALRSGAGLFA